jgi:hypothetical protein
MASAAIDLISCDFCPATGFLLDGPIERLMLLAAALGAAFMARSAIDDGLCSHFVLIGPQALDPCYRPAEHSRGASARFSLALKKRGMTP